MEHRFYSKSKKEQIQIQAIIAFGASILLLLSIFISWITGVYLIGIFAFPLVISIIAPFFDIPSLKKSGKLIYHSPLFLTERKKNGVIKIHGGTLFDYVFVIDKKMNGKRRTNFILQQYLYGLLHFLEKLENTEIENLKIRGTSYMINERTVERIGFKVINTDFIQKLILMYNYFNILISYSIAKGKLAFPNLWDTKTFEAQLNDLIKHKKYLEELNDKLKRNLANS
jgi:hypothetical protein